MGREKFWSKYKNLLWLLAILAIAAFFRFWDLAGVPPGLYPDVAINGTDALKALDTGQFKIFYPANNGREGLFINLIALSFWFFGAHIWALKLVSAAIGLLTVWSVYLLTQKLFGYLRPDKATLVARLAAFFMAISFWHVNFSRLGFRAILVPFCLTWSLYFLFCLIREIRLGGPSKIKIALWAIAGGFFFGLGFHTYIAFRVAPLVLAPAAIFAFFLFGLSAHERVTKKIGWFKACWRSYRDESWWGWELFILIAILTLLPMAFYFWQNPTDFMGRTSQVSVLASGEPLKGLLTSAIKTLGQFVVWGDANWRHNLAGSPQIFWPLIPFFIWGLGFSFWQLFKRNNWQHKDWLVLQTHSTLLVWWGAMLLPSILTNEGLPHALRSIGAIPPSLIFTGLGAFLFISFLQHKLKKHRKYLALFLLGIIVILASLLILEFWRYFIVWGQNPEVKDAFTQRFVNQGRYLSSLPSEIKKVVLVNEDGVPVPYPNGLPMPAQTIIFLNQKTANLKYLAKEPEPDKRDEPCLQLDKNQPMVFLPMKPDP
ncbi:MAG: hypothetical protein AAB724_01300, partial [Patescibacteria group bacterium]